jgi:16S rRNA (guanine(966)-N(2))-methyltransferase RsmD
MSKALFYHIVAGKYKGKKLFLPSLETTRSTKTILKESFFNVVQNEIVGKDFFEVFGGSGSMGLEALSRGAKKCYFIEIDKESFAILQKNIKLIDSTSCEAIKGDAFEKFASILQQLSPSSILYFDPPFSYREGMDAIYDKTLNLIASIDPTQKHLIVVEHMSKLQMPNTIGPFLLTKSKKFGKTTISYFKA